MSYAQRQRNPTRHLVSIGAVMVLHLLIVWALVSGLARKVVQVVREPVQAKIIEEVKPPPPPERLELPPPPKFVPPPPAWVPPPEVQIQAPPPPQPTITVAPAPPPVEPPPVQAPRVELPPPAPPAPMAAAVVCPGYTVVLNNAGYPREALRAGIEKGSVTLKLLVGSDGAVRNVDVVHSSNRAFNRGAVEAARSIGCVGQGRDIEVLLPIDYRLQ